MRTYSLGYLSLFLGTIVGIGIGIVLSLAFKNQTFPLLDSGLYFGEIQFKNNEYHLLIEVPKDNPDEFIIINRIGQNHTTRSKEKLNPQKIGFFNKNSYQPIPITIDASMLTLMGHQIGDSDYQGNLLDSNRNKVGVWNVKLVEESLENSKEEDIKLRALLDSVKESSELNQKIKNSQSDSDKIDNEISKANLLLSEIKKLSSEGDEKLRESKIKLDQSEKKYKIAEQRLYSLQQQVIVTQKYSPQGKLYEASKESLRLEKKWFLNQVRMAQINEVKEVS
jgi:hypothetical protein